MFTLGESYRKDDRNGKIMEGGGAEFQKAMNVLSLPWRCLPRF
jgi:hypothetical protein